ncbi:hypothetical protein [Mycolicibacterium wolinskyi]|nr:hypothetical protein [Mycolicibacterium wolinskyi]
MSGELKACDASRIASAGHLGRAEATGAADMAASSPGGEGRR